MDRIRNRTLDVRAAGPENRAAAARVLRTLPGVCGADSTETGLLRVTYDLAKVQLGTILRTLDAAGFPVRVGIAGAIRLKLASFMEENEHDNLAAPPAPCCSNPPRARR